MAQFFFDFSGIGTGAGLPSGWTERWPGDDYSREAGPLIRVSRYSTTPAMAGYDAPGLVSGNWEVLVRGKSSGTGFDNGPGPAFGTAGASFNGFLLFTSDTGTVKLQRWASGAEAASNEAATPYTVAADTYYWFRMRRNGSTVQGKTWAGLITDEPGTWQVSLADDASAASGYFGVTGARWVNKDYNLIGVGTGTDVAPSTAPSSATKLTFTTQPQNTVVGNTMPSVVVAAQDAGNVTDTTFTGNITIALQTGSGVLSGTLTRAAVAGVATFDNLSINTLNTGAVLRATASGLTLADSAGFNIVAASSSTAGGSRITSRLVQ